MSSKASSRPKSGFLRINKNCPPEKEINILLLGQTGVGKSTFINSFVNYLVNDTLDQAIHDEIQFIIPTSFSYTDTNTFEQRTVTIGEKKDNTENIDENGQSTTQQCRTFVFPIGDRILRLIDTPGMGDTRGLEQDNKNLFEILTHISHYEHLNGICIFLKPNEERLTISFRLCIKQILHYLHKSAAENIIFIFTNSRTTFFMPGSSKKMLQVILNEHRDQNQSEVPLTKENTFLLDNESFRYLVMHKKGVKHDAEQIECYRKSWVHTVKEYERLMTYIAERSLLAISNTLSLNEAEQLIRKLPRPIAETLRLIQQNIQLAKQYKQDVAQKSSNVRQGLPQYRVQIMALQHPRLVCFGRKCSRVVKTSNENKFEPFDICEEKSYLNGVIQEAISDLRIAECAMINNKTDKCAKCDCSWKKHMNITYQYHTELIYQDMDNTKKGNKDNQSLLKFIDKHIHSLEEEQAMIEETYITLSKFLYANALYPFNDDILNYLRLFSLQEQMKSEAGVQNDDIRVSLVALTTKYEDEMDKFRKTLSEENNSENPLKNEKIFELVGTLYRLPITGGQIRQQVDSLKISEQRAVKRMEHPVELPQKAAHSQIINTLRDIISDKL